MLKLIQDMQRREEEENKTKRIVPPHLNPQSKPSYRDLLALKRDVDPKSVKLGSHEALEYVSWLVKADRLFDVALTTYDFDLVSLVATQTQKDPKEYVPYLLELKAMDPVLMRFRIHLDLKHYETAVKKLARGDRSLSETHPEVREAYFEEALALVKKHRLFRQALDFYSHSQPLTKRLKAAFAEYLQLRGYSEEAGFLYAAAEDTASALQAFKKSLNVEMCLAIAAGMDQAQREELVDELAERLKNASRYEVRE